MERLDLKGQKDRFGAMERPFKFQFETFAVPSQTEENPTSKQSHRGPTIKRCKRDQVHRNAFFVSPPKFPHPNDTQR